MTTLRGARILAALDTPQTVRELSDLLRREVLEAWAEENDYEIDWGTDAEPVGARLLAISAARRQGVYAGLPHEIYPRLRYLERHGFVERIQVAGRRPMLWRRVERQAS